MTFGEQLTAQRKKLGLSQLELAKLLTEKTGKDFSQTYLSTLESRDSLPKWETLQALEEFFNIKFDDPVRPSDDELFALLKRYRQENKQLRELIRTMKDLLNSFRDE